MRTSEQWWDQTKADPAKFHAWLVKQHRGEVTAARRIRDFAEQHVTSTSDHEKKVLELIASQEEQHASWVLDLLHARGISADVSGAEKRYWSKVMPVVDSFEHGCAVGAHAEKMRLERIRTICIDDDAPQDVRATFQRILKDEVFHESAFRNLAGHQAMLDVAPDASRGRRLLGLTP